MTPTEANTVLEQAFAPWVRALGLQITEIGPERAVMTMPITPDILRIGDIVSGQALAALADTAMVFAAFGHLDAVAPVNTVTLDTQFLRPATGTSIRAETQITRAGKSMIFAQATLVAEPSEKAVAFVTATFAR